MHNAIRKLIALAFALSACAFNAVAATSITVSHGTGGPGNTVSIPLSWSSDSNSQTFQFDIQYDASLFSNVSIGDCVQQLLALGQNGSLCAIVDITGGLGSGTDAVRILAFGFPPSAIPSGDIGTLGFTIATDAPEVLTPLSISQPVVGDETDYTLNDGSIDIVAVGPPVASLAVGEYTALQDEFVTSSTSWTTGGSAIGTFHIVDFDIEYDAAQFSSVGLTNCVQTATNLGMDSSTCSIIDVSGGIGSGVDAVRIHIESSSGLAFDGPEIGQIEWQIASQAATGQTPLSIVRLSHDAPTVPAVTDGSIIITSTDPPLVTLTLSNPTAMPGATTTMNVYLDVEGSATTTLTAINFDVCFDSSIIASIDYSHCLDGAIAQGQNFSACGIHPENLCSDGPWDTTLRFFSVSTIPHPFVSGELGAIELNISSAATSGVSVLKLENIYFSEDPPAVLNHGSVTITTAPVLTWQPDSGEVDLLNAEIGQQTSSQTVSYTESGQTDVELQSCVISGPDAAAFNLQASATLPHLMPGGSGISADLDLLCQPDHFGDHTAQLSCDVTDPLSGDALVERKAWSLKCFGNVPNYSSSPVGSGNNIVLSAHINGTATHQETVLNPNNGATSQLNIISVTSTGDPEIQVSGGTGTIAPDDPGINFNANCATEVVGNYSGGVNVQSNDTFHFPPDGIISYTVSCDVLPAADLTISLSEDIDPAIPGETVTYTFEVENQGPATANNLLIQLQTAPEVEVESIGIDGGSCAPILDRWECSLGSLLSSARVSGNLNASLNQPGSIAVEASVSADELDPESNDNSVSELTQVALSADSDAKIVGCSTIQPPVSEVVLGAVVRNSGPTHAVDLTVEIAFSAGIDLIAIDPEMPECQLNPDMLSCQFSVLSSGEQKIWRMSTSVNSTQASEQVTMLLLSASDPNASNDSDTLTLKLVDNLIKAGSFEAFVNCQPF